MGLAHAGKVHAKQLRSLRGAKGNIEKEGEYEAERKRKRETEKRGKR